jgi:hypothetical protein
MDGARSADVAERTHVPRPTWTRRRSWGHAEIGPDAAAHIDRVLTFHGLDPAKIRDDYFDTCRRRDFCRLSWVARRSEYPAAQTWRHELVRFALDDLVIRAGKTVLIESPFDDPVELVTYRLAIEPGGVLRIEAPFALSVGQLLGLPAIGAKKDALRPRIEVCAVSGHSAAAGAPGAPGGDGTREEPNGNTGSAGAIGQAGTNGRALPDQRFFFHTLMGHIELSAHAGAGGAGGAGGPGGPGGRGHAVAFFDMGQGGDGGPGGPGGDGGGGGNGGKISLGIRVRHPSSALSLLLDQPAPGGIGGSGGMPGAGGLGAPDGRQGASGPDGRTGAAGAPITVTWTEGENGDV